MQYVFLKLVLEELLALGKYCIRAKKKLYGTKV